MREGFGQKNWRVEMGLVERSVSKETVVWPMFCRWRKGPENAGEERLVNERVKAADSTKNGRSLRRMRVAEFPRLRTRGVDESPVVDSHWRASGSARGRREG
jgi:hypothetical protein